MSCNNSKQPNFFIDDVMLGAFEFQFVSSLKPIYASSSQQSAQTILLHFKSLAIQGSELKTLYGCLISRLVEGRFYLSWHRTESFDSCHFSDPLIAMQEELSGFDLSVSTEELAGIMVGVLKIDSRKNVKGTLKVTTQKYYLLNWKNTDITDNHLKPKRIKALFAAPFLNAAIEGVQFSAAIAETSMDGPASSLILVKNLPPSQFPELIKCAEWDDLCRPIMDDKCHLCQQGHSQIMHSKCPTLGLKFCGAVECGGKGKPPCHLGRSHIENEDFMGCSELSEEWLCHPGLILDCAAKPYPLCH